jgi:ribosome-associated protein
LAFQIQILEKSNFTFEMAENLDTESLLAECTFTAVRSGGKGGQNVNKVSSKVILYFNVNESLTLDDGEKELIHANLMTRINKEGVLQLSSSVERSQLDNKKRVQEKFIKLISAALVIAEERIETKVPLSAKRKRKEEKIQKSVKKQLRSGIPDEEFNL